MLSPTSVNDLMTCGYRLAWRRDERAGFLRRPTPWTELGVIAHSVLEDAGHGLVASAATIDEARHRAETAWNTHVSISVERLKKAWYPADPPRPEEWPGYHLTRARTIRQVVRRERSDASAVPASGRNRVAYERRIVDKHERLVGRPDRIERSETELRIVDLKTGLGQRDPTDAQVRQLLLYCHLVKVQHGRLPTQIVIEDASGRRWDRPVSSLDVDTVLDEMRAARERYIEAERMGGPHLESLAEPAAETCRWCSYRSVCRPYWSSLEQAWDHGSVADAVRATRRTPAGVVLEIETCSPIEKKKRRRRAPLRSRDDRADPGSGRANHGGKCGENSGQNTPTLEMVHDRRQPEPFQP